MGTLAALLATALSAGPAAAWDPSTTHQGLLEAAVTRSALHLRWMDGSELERGLFSDLRVDPQALSVEERRMLELALRGAHADLGASPLGGPGSCPRADAPPQTQLFCVDQDLWQQSALGWLRLGMIAEVSPPARHAHHFLDRDAPESAQWEDRELSPALLRMRQARSNGEPAAGVATGTNFSGKSPSALAWLDDPNDLLAPPTAYAHLQLASTAPSKAERDHHLALALLGVGALLHVVQDLSVPAHARGDATAFFSPLSPATGDRGLPLQEFVRLAYGRRDLPLAAAAAPTGEPLADSVRDHLLGHDHGQGGFEGLATLAARRFFSESSLPAPAYLDDTLTPSEAAATLLGDDHGLLPIEVEGAVLSPWPAQRGYLLSPTGRALAAFDTDSEGRIRPYLDETCYRDQAATLLPAAVDHSRSILDLLWPAWPATRRAGDELRITVPAWERAELLLLLEDTDGSRRELSRTPLSVGEESRVALEHPALAPGQRVVMVLLASRPPGPPITIEHVLGERLPSGTGPGPGPSPDQDESAEAPKPGHHSAVEPAPIEPVPF